MLFRSVMENFLKDDSLEYLQFESRELRHLAYFCHQNHNAYLLEPDPDLPDGHIRNLDQTSDKGCVTHDQIPVNSPLRTLYEWPGFRSFLEAILGDSIFPYTDSLSSININYFERGQQLGWHYDNASFAVTLMVQAPEQGGEFREPFLGGGSVAIHISKKYPHLKITVNDLYEPLINFWVQLQTFGDELTEKIREYKRIYDKRR